MKKLYYLAFLFPVCQGIDLTTEKQFDPIKYGNKVYEAKDPRNVAVTEEMQKKELQKSVEKWHLKQLEISRYSSPTQREKMELDYLLNVAPEEVSYYMDSTIGLGKSVADRK